MTNDLLGFKDIQSEESEDTGPTFYNEEQLKRPLIPEQLLMLAIIKDAIECLMDSDRLAEWEDAKVYLLARDVMDAEGKPWLFSFESCCEHLDLDPDYMRHGVFKRYYRTVFDL